MALKTEQEIRERIKILKGNLASFTNPDGVLALGTEGKIAALKWVLNGGTK